MRAKSTGTVVFHAQPDAAGIGQDGGMRAQRVLVSGRVQNVWFRDSCRREAQRLDLVGWVRNLPDGRVEVHVEGQDDEAIAALVAWCHDGPPNAVVDEVRTALSEPEGLTDFTIR